MAVTIPASFPERGLMEHVAGAVVDVPDAQDLVEGGNWLLAHARNQHVGEDFVERRRAGGATTTVYRVSETDTTGLVLKLVYLVRLGHARANAADGVRLRYMISAGQTGLGTGTVDIQAVWSGGTITTTQSIVGGAGVVYYVLGPTTRMNGDEEIRVEVRINANAAILNGTLTLLNFSVVESDLAVSDIPPG